MTFCMDDFVGCCVNCFHSFMVVVIVDDCKLQCENLKAQAELEELFFGKVSG